MPQSKAQIKHIKNFSIKNFGPPEAPPPQNFLYVWAFSCILKGKEPPNIKNLRGQGSLLGGGSRRGISGKILYVYAFFRGLTKWQKESEMSSRGISATALSATGVQKVQNLDGQIRANRFGNSRESPDSRESPEGFLDEGQITHLICARLKYDLYDFFRGVLGLLPLLFLV